ncbi:DoxX family protein [Catenulispora acidiphila DSM 44928]|uniref:DoxX family protein n=1 Tax=Catenulispora acidiphila (strain DSM 44928 / JCM 14897 / NBRC 102108 / NRRL B-24433 / ID139908) TaxID=479433 RepID=C7PZU5_CATAD|nr:DoxX family protein [Catenulispora acidiphila DSM 44928]
MSRPGGLSRPGNVNIFLWILQAVLAAFFALSGLGKAFQSKEKVLVKAPVLENYAPGTIRFIGAAELAGAIGLVLPRALGVATVLTPLAAVGIAVMMLLGALAHFKRGEWLGVGVTLVLCLLAVVVCVGR